MKMYDDLPSELDESFRRMVLENETRLALHQYRSAKAGFEQTYKMLLDAQPHGKRYHKGHALHNAGVATFQMGDQQDALHYFILAYIEDILSQPEGEEDNADTTPASRTVRDGYHVDPNLIRALKEVVKNAKKRGVVAQDPEQILKELDQKSDGATKGATGLVGGNRKPGQFRSEWKNRVFVGGSYSNHIAEISRIGKICEELGFDPVIASRFETQPNRVHHHALMLLHECRRAIFEVSDDVGQLMEIERLRDYQVSALMLCQKDKDRLSAMLPALFASSGCRFQQYSDIDEMDGHVRQFLRETEE